MSTHFTVGSHKIKYHEAEMHGDYPREIFIDFKMSSPFIYQQSFLAPDEISFLYEGALQGHQDRKFATVHDYAPGGSGAKVDITGRYTHYVPCAGEVYTKLEETQARIYKIVSDYYDLKGGALQRTEGWQVLGYGPGFFFSNHCDNCVGGSMAVEERHRSQAWWCNTPNRKFTVLMYLNSQNDHYAAGGSYSGGDLRLTRIDDENGNMTRFKPQAGDLIAFPSNYFFTHEVLKVTRGYRFSCVTWLNIIPPA